MKDNEVERNDQRIDEMMNMKTDEVRIEVNMNIKSNDIHFNLSTEMQVGRSLGWNNLLWINCWY